MLTDQVRRLMLTRDDWVFRARRRLLCCVGRGPFFSPAEIGERITAVLAIATAIPAVLGQPAPHPGSDPDAGPPLAAAPPARLVPASMAAAAAWTGGGGPGDATLIMPAPVGRVLVAPVAPADRSAADLTAALGRLASIDEALGMLASLTPGEHETLAGLDTPLAALAGAQTAPEAAARYRALPPQRKLQLAAMLMRARDARARR